ncbi:hydrogen peroxide-inducible genes activator [Granulibacter bethesdensis]|uniref:Hydrogen peroxide-inducible genes activator n=1 Tax=Granulibacter bethesdensis (strain ATCC BAA-1260 / CGDNIH1) TaxID=391165 RepID=Q0BUC3_GRABC|nr:hydrogen peroxide-inducible genes activator [Granulibacter bethesdensis]ABI61579.1 Hydrogen peroxide-inducible genes activator [Granulibacter bethesdensis CGDNIH1]AHJ67716.1 Hydrogen peroxide-inducible genes activator [Granulibacter bethesdensis]APH51379.1 Hydrogen peroxide-inducible genes activator [Granulibacter bethesdensis]APH64072.1 Hydrogen peroxide-inducible genes activator [Granulibacter bethesdensis]
MTPLPTPQQLRYLMALAEYQHFGRAAQACAVTQSTLSAGILALERQLDVQILDRVGGKRVIFTALGRDLVERARDAMHALEAMSEAASAARAPMSGPLRVGVIPTIGPFLLPRLMPALRREYPNLRLYLREDTTDRLMARLRDGRLDLLLLAMPCDCRGMDTVVIGRDSFLVALPQGHRLAEREVIPIEALSMENLLLLEDGHCLREHALAVCGLLMAYEKNASEEESAHKEESEAGPVRNVATRSRDMQTGDGLADQFAATSLHTLVQMVAGGLGITLLPQIAVDAGVMAGTSLVLRPLEGDGAWRELGLAWRHNAPRGADYLGMASLLREAAGF